MMLFMSPEPASIMIGIVGRVSSIATTRMMLRWFATLSRKKDETRSSNVDGTHKHKNSVKEEDKNARVGGGAGGGGGGGGARKKRIRLHTTYTCFVISTSAETIRPV